MEILTDFRPDIDFENEVRLMEDRVLDSFDIVTLVQDIRDEYDVEIAVKDLVPENFNSATQIYAMIERLQKED